MHYMCFCVQYMKMRCMIIHLHMINYYNDLKQKFEKVLSTFIGYFFTLVRKVLG